MSLDHFAALAIEAYDKAGDWAAEKSREAQKKGKPLTARIRAQWSLIAHRAARAEFFDPEPTALAVTPCCPWCLFYMGLPSDTKPVPVEEVA